jgi:hypothetical protein
MVNDEKAPETNRSIHMAYLERYGVGLRDEEIDFLRTVIASVAEARIEETEIDAFNSGVETCAELVERCGDRVAAQYAKMMRERKLSIIPSRKPEGT